MSREIKFRGRRVDNGEWVYGDLIHGVGPKSGLMYILPPVINLAYLPGCDPLDGYDVIPETVGQFTGLKDKNGVEIYEGDIIACPYIDPIGGLHDEEDEDKRSFVMFVHGAFCLKYPHHHTPLVDWCHRTKGEYIPNYGNKTIISDTSPIEVIGNIYEHKHLLHDAQNPKA